MLKLNLTGQSFGRLVVVAPARNRGGRTYWKCRCHCGRFKAVATAALRRRLTQSCGCWQREVMREVGARRAKHGLYGDPLYNVFMKMRDRCENPKARAYRRYGGCGICCLFSGPIEFIEWARQHGYRKGLTVERINNDGHYEPANCRMATMKEQQRNRGNTLFLDVGDVRKPLAEWAEIAGMKYETLRRRVRMGVPAAVALGMEPPCPK